MTETIHITAEESTTTTVIEAVAEETGREPHELPTLYEVVDPDALNRLTEGSRIDRKPNVTVTFDMAGCTVRVTDVGEVTVERTEDLGARAETEQAEVPDGERAEVPDGESTDSPSGIAEATSSGGLAFEGSR